jgi:hypothetical protein
VATTRQVNPLLRQLLYSLVCAGVFAGFAVIWSAKPTIKSATAMMTLDLKALSGRLAEGDLSPFALRQRVQMHFLDNGIYLPLEDITLSDQAEDQNNRTIFLMRNACGEGKLFIWVPFRIRLPLFGNSVWEYCWTPSL